MLVVGRRNPGWFDVRDYGSVTPGTSPTAGQVTANTTAIQAAIDAAESTGGGTVFIPFSYRVSALTVDAAGVTLLGASRESSGLETTSGDLLTLSGTASARKFTARHLKLRSRAGGGHIFKVATSISRALWLDLMVQQDNNDKAIYWHEGDDYIDNVWLHIDAQHTLGATIASWHIKSTAANRNLWSQIRPTYSGNYVWWIESTAAASYASDNVVEGITSEINNGGLLKVRGGQGTVLRDTGIYDLGTTTRDLIVLETSDSGVQTFNTTLQNVRRHGGTLGSGLYDVSLSGSAADPRLSIINCGGITDLHINANSKRIAIYDSSDVVLTNGSLAKHYGPSGTRHPVRSITSNLSVAANDSGATYVTTAGSGTITYTLPATQAGIEYTFLCGDAGSEIALSPNAADRIMGKGITAADDKDYINTNATNAVGDLVTIRGDGADGWWVVNERGTWAREA